MSRTDLPTLKKYYGTPGDLDPLKEKDGNLYGVFTAATGESFTRGDLQEIENYLKNRDATYYAAGSQYLEDSLVDYLLMILRFLPLSAYVLIFLVFRFQMGSTKATLLSVLPAGVGALWVLGLIGWTVQAVSMVAVLVPIFTVVIGSADGLHFVSHMQEARAAGDGKKKAVVETLNMVGTPILVTTLTSMVGFLSLIFINASIVVDLAIFASVGILLAGVATWYILPLILTGRLEIHRPGFGPDKEGLKHVIDRSYRSPARPGYRWV
ncbi:MAG: MMPL family transporter [Candidatus Bipolaricaulota bacterium]